MSYSGQHRFKPNYVVLNREGTIGASSDLLGDIHVWDATTGRKIIKLQSQKSELYKVGWDRTGTKLHFSVSPHPQGTYSINNRGPLNRTFDLISRHVAKTTNPDAFQMQEAGRATIAGQDLLVSPQIGKSYSYFTNLDEIETTEDPNDGIMGKAYSTLVMPPNSANRLNAPAIVGSDKGEVHVIDRDSDGYASQRRKFIGHTPSLITSIAPSPNGEMIATSSTDGTIRIWSLRGISDAGVFDFGIRGTQVLDVPGAPHWEEQYQSEGYKAGIRDTDEILSVNGIPYYEYQETSISQKAKPGEFATVVVRQRASAQNGVGPERKLRVKMVRGAEKVRPLLSLFISQNGDWIIWTPDGYYDASPGGDRYIGFHINQGDDKAALWYTAAQFEQQLYRPDIIDLVLRKGSPIDANDFRGDSDAPLSPQSDLANFQPPKLLIQSPADGLRTRRSQVELRATVTSATSAPVRQVRITVNGRPVSIDQEIDGIRSTQLVQQLELTPGRNTIEMFAADRQTKSETASFDVEYVNDQQKSAFEDLGNASNNKKLHILAVGVSEYSESRINLNYADKDARDFVAAWERQRGYYRDIDSTVLTNADATRGSVLKAVRELGDRVDVNERVILFFSAHGAVDEEDNYYLLPHDVDPEGLLESAILHTTIQKTIDTLLAKGADVLMFVDTCHSGGATGAKSLEAKGIRLRQSKKDAWRNMRDTSCIVFASSQPGQESFEDPAWENGAFTEAIVEALDFAPSAAPRALDSELSVDELTTYLGERVPALTNEKQNPGIMRNSNTPSFVIAIEQ